jgi:DNA-binding NtrC family response regulator
MNDIDNGKNKKPIALIGSSEVMKQMRDFALKAASIKETIFLSGETGVGKDCFASYIHFLGRQEREFVSVDCGALNEGLTEAELFGHTGGAFTGAQGSKIGLVEMAKEGTLFFNEVANMSLALQAKFLRILDFSPFRPIGAVKEIEMNTRIIAATNANLKEGVRKGRLRLDLFHRLNVITFTIPPLRDRAEDIPELVSFFLRQGEAKVEFSSGALAVMQSYDWPGNIRELKNVVAKAVFNSSGEKEIDPEAVEACFSGVNANGFLSLEENERRYWRDIFSGVGGDISQAASVSGIPAKEVRNKIKQFSLMDFVESLRD